VLRQSSGAIRRHSHPIRPLRVLFVGSVAAFKGVPSLLESLDHSAMRRIELRLVGPLAATIPQKFLGIAA
jgi:hypothetical protein